MASGDRWQVDETYVKVAAAGATSIARSTSSARSSTCSSLHGGTRRLPVVLERVIDTTRVMPIEVTTDRAAAYPAVLDDLLPATWHRTDQYANNRIECDHGG